MVGTAQWYWGDEREARNRTENFIECEEVEQIHSSNILGGEMILETRKNTRGSYKNIEQKVFCWREFFSCQPKCKN